MKPRGFKRRSIRRKPGFVPAEVLRPTPKTKGASYVGTKDYKYFEGHIVPEVSVKLPPASVFCWKTSHLLTLPICANKKFWQQTKYCMRCPLFQDDTHAQELKSLIKHWEFDDLEEDK